jgi:CheY-like chemotaxis protein
MHILVVDDNQTDRFVIRKLLENSFRITTLSSALEAKAFAASNTFDVALLNAMLETDLDSIQLLRDLRIICKQPSFVSFATTSHVDELRHSRLMEAGFRAVMRKPFSVTEFNYLLDSEF